MKWGFPGNSVDLCTGDVQFDIKTSILYIPLCQEETMVRFGNLYLCQVSGTVQSVDLTTCTAVAWFDDKRIVVLWYLLEQTWMGNKVGKRNGQPMGMRVRGSDGLVAYQ